MGIIALLVVAISIITFLAVTYVSSGFIGGVGGGLFGALGLVGSPALIVISMAFLVFPLQVHQYQFHHRTTLQKLEIERNITKTEDEENSPIVKPEIDFGSVIMPQEDLKEFSTTKSELTFIRSHNSLGDIIKLMEMSDKPLNFAGIPITEALVVSVGGYLFTMIVSFASS